MRYIELKENYFPEHDHYHMAHIEDGRKTRLTLKHLNKLRKVREMRKADQEKNKEFVATMYAQPPAMQQYYVFVKKTSQNRRLFH